MENFYYSYFITAVREQCHKSNINAVLTLKIIATSMTKYPSTYNLKNKAGIQQKCTYMFMNKTCTKMFMKALCVLLCWKQRRCPSMVELWYTYTME